VQQNASSNYKTVSAFSCVVGKDESFVKVLFVLLLDCQSL